MTAIRPVGLGGKVKRLQQALTSCGRIVVGFSGGKDSFFLAREAVQVLGAANVFAFFVRTPFTGKGTLERIAYFRKIFPAPVREIRADLLASARMQRNPRDRCFRCKKRMFTILKTEARRMGIDHVADGSNAADSHEHRPGRTALAELGIVSPLRDAGISGDEIAAVLRSDGIAERFLTSSTCLATRFPYGHSLALREIAAIGEVEHYLFGRGIFPVRVRHIPDGVRVETVAAHFQALLALKDDLLSFCRRRGLRFVTIDLGGIQSGAWDRVEIKSKKAKGKRQK